MRKARIVLFLLVLSCSFALHSFAQTDTTRPVTTIDADLLNIFNQKVPKKYKVATIKFTGSKYFDEALLLSITGISPGQEVTIPGSDIFSQAITKLMAQNYFSDAKVYITGLHGDLIDLEIEVAERPRLSSFTFKNVRKGEADELKPKSGLVPGRVITQNMKITAVDAVKKYYFEKGFRNVRVTVQEVSDPSTTNYEFLNLIVDKGNKVKISQINLTGNTIDAAKLKRQLKETHEMNRLTLYPPNDFGGFVPANRYSFSEYLQDKGYLTYNKTKKVLDPYVRLGLSGAKYDEKKYAEDKEKLIEYYNSIGYRDAVVTRDTVYYNDRGNMNIDLAVKEGHKYYFGNISWRGNTKYSDSLLTAIVGIHKGDVFNADILRKKLNSSGEGADVGSLYLDDGYLFFQAEPIETAVYQDTIDFEIRLREGPQATIKNVRITGNDKTKEHVIRREIRTIPGDKFSRELLVRSQREIANLNFFNQEKINPQPIPNVEDGTVDINYSLEEKSSDQLELSAGFGGGIGLTGTVGVTFNNFSIRNIFSKKAWDPLPTGDGQKLSIRVQSNGAAYISENLSFTEPWLGGKKRNSLTVSLYNTRFANAFDPRTGTYTSEAADTSYFKTTGLSVGIGKQLKWPDDFFTLGMTLSYARYTLKNYYIDAINLPKFNNGNSNNLNIKIALQRSSVSAPIFPTSGSNLIASLQFTPPWSALDPGLIHDANPYKLIEYHKWRFTGEWYVPIGRATGEDRNKQLVLKFGAKYGFIGRYNYRLNISPFERFQVGDAGLSNTYALLGYDIISQRGYPVYETSNVNVNPDQQGASRYFTIFNKYTMELRYPLSLNPSSTIYGLTFFEAANGWYDVKNWNPFQLRRSVGVGMRFFLPMFGLLGFDYGIGLDRIDVNGLKNAGRFTFMLGFEPE